MIILVLVSQLYKIFPFQLFTLLSFIILINDDAYEEEYDKRIKINNKSLSWNERDELRKNIVKSNIDNDKMIYTLDFTLTKI